jgi:hypothetical protein
VREGLHAVQLVDTVELFRHEYTQTLQTATPASYVPVLQTQAPLTRVREGSQAVQVEAAPEQLRHEYTQLAQTATPAS